MAGFQLSPGVVVNEIDLTGIVPGVGTTEGAFAGSFAWGPVKQIVTVANESELVTRFGKPDSNTFVPFFTAANFLAYGNNLKTVRTSNSALRNATADGSGLLIENEVTYTSDYYDGSGAVGGWAARYAGSLGNSIRVSECYSANGFSGTLAATANVNVGNTTVVFTANVQADAARALVPGDYITIGTLGEVQVTSITADGLNATINTSSVISSNLSAQTVVGRWQYSAEFQGAPGTSTYVANKGGSNDEMHVIVIDKDGRFSGTPGTILEKYQYVSKAFNAKNDDGTTNYYRDAIFNRSQYVYWMDHNSAGTNWGNVAEGTTFTVVNRPLSSNLAGGIYATSTDADKILAFDKFVNPEEIDISLVVTGDASTTVATHIISNILESRRDCVGFFSPSLAAAVDNAGSEQDDVITHRNALTSTSYASIDSGWKYQFDKYNGVYRWVPLNGDVAGLCVRTDNDRDPWYSPAGYNRGQIKNVTKLSWIPNKTNRDELYKKGINPVVTFPGEGTVLYGDKTMLSKPSAFDRINVRRLFIVLEKAIARAAKYSLFEFNDRFTRAQFVNMVEPFLRDVKGRRGIYDFRVVCDETNNTPTVIDRNEFVGDIYIKPARSINFITLNFVAVGTGVTFEEVVGSF